MSVPPSLQHPDLESVWARAAEHLARFGLDRRGVVRIEPLTGAAALALQSLVGGQAGRARRTVDLAVLEAALARVGVADDLPSALAELGHAVPAERLHKRAAKVDAARARAAFREEVAAWPVPWAETWADGVVHARLLADLDVEQARNLARAVQRVVTAARTAADHGGPPRSRTEIAAREIGDAHALDPGTRLHQATIRALELLHPDVAVGDRWAAAGMASDTVSAPVLTWGLDGSHPLLAAGRAAGIPVHLSLIALRSTPVRSCGAGPVLVVENPRLVEAAAQRGWPQPMVCANGNPSAAVRLLLDQLLATGAAMRYHGDFDAAGLAMCARMASLGAEPWRMDATDYVAAIEDAEAQAVALPYDPSPAPATPWSPELQHVFDAHGLVVHEERLTDELLAVGGA